MNIVGIIPARGGSTGVPRKNIKLLNGIPLIDYSINAALKSEFINHVVVNTEDAEISSIAKREGIYVQSRPKDFWYDNTFQEVDRLLAWSIHDLENNYLNKKADLVVLLYPTSPLRSQTDIDNCIKLVLKENYDSALSLCEDRSYLWKRDGDICEPLNYDPANRGPNQMEGWNQWRENKAVYCTKRNLLVDSKCRLGGRIGASIMPKLRSIDIDLPDDFSLAEAILQSM